MMDKLLSRNIIILIILIILALLSFSFIKNNFFTNEKIVLDNVKLREELSNDFFSLLIEQEDGTYEESTDNSWPSNMRFNTELSGCVNISGNKINNALSFDYVNNTVNVSAGETQFCYLYFDLPKPSVTLTVSTDGTNNTLPTYNHYKQTLTCDDGTNSYFNVKYQRIEISQVNKISTTCNLNYTNDSNIYTLLKTQVQEKGTKITSTNNAGGTDISYRYTGKTPDNFVWFNNEMWRIIGLIPVCTTSGCGTPDTSLVKIMRNESIGGIAYDAKDSGYTGVWGSNTLYQLLNQYYYGAKNGIGTNYCYGYYDTTYRPVPNCDYTYIGISSEETDYYGRMVKNVFWNTGASSNTGTTNAVYTTETATQTVSGKIGLISLSDYGYAGLYYKVAIKSSTFANYTSSNWLFRQSYEWTSIQDSGSTEKAIFVYNRGNAHINDTYNGYAVRPALYLDSSVYIISGNGTEGNPYILGM